MGDDTAFDLAWREHRAYLVDLAFRMLRDIGQAEDVVQVAFSRLLQADPERIEDPRAWLTVVTSRLCLNEIQSAQRRRERSEDPDILTGTVVAGGPAPADPADRITLDDRVRLAMVVMLERLSPAERVAFVLHDVFGTPFDAVAESLGRSPATCRQLARRARQKLNDAGSRRHAVDAAEHRHVTERFIAACASGDLDALVAVLDPDVSGTTDYDGRVVTGAHAVATGALRYLSGSPDNRWGAPATLVSQPLGDQTALLSYVRHRLRAVIVLDIAAERVTEIHAVIRPDQLAFLAAQLGGAAE